MTIAFSIILHLFLLPIHLFLMLSNRYYSQQKCRPLYLDVIYIGGLSLILFRFLRNSIVICIYNIPIFINLCVFYYEVVWSPWNFDQFPAEQSRFIFSYSVLWKEVRLQKDHFQRFAYSHLKFCLFIINCGCA